MNILTKTCGAPKKILIFGEDKERTANELIAVGHKVIVSNKTSYLPNTFDVVICCNLPDDLEAIRKAFGYFGKIAYSLIFKMTIRHAKNNRGFFKAQFWQFFQESEFGVTKLNQISKIKDIGNELYIVSKLS